MGIFDETLRKIDKGEIGIGEESKVSDILSKQIPDGQTMSVEEQAEEHHQHLTAPARDIPDSVTQQGELEKAIDKAIQSLPEKQRLAVSLRRYEDMPYEEICEILGMSLSAVKSLLFRARNDLKEKLSAYLDEGD